MLFLHDKFQVLHTPTMSNVPGVYFFSFKVFFFFWLLRKKKEQCNLKNCGSCFNTSQGQSTFLFYFSFFEASLECILVVCEKH